MSHLRRLSRRQSRPGRASVSQGPCVQAQVSSHYHPVGLYDRTGGATARRRPQTALACSEEIDSDSGPCLTGPSASTPLEARIESAITYSSNL